MRLECSWRAVLIALLAVGLGSSAWPSRAQAQLGFGGQPFTHGSGWIPLLATGGKGTFSVLGGFQKDLTPRGHLIYIDHDIDFRVESTSISGFTPGCLSTIEGVGDSNFGPVDFVVAVTDGGKTGHNDAFTIITGGAFTYAQAGILGGGNVKAHGLPCPP
jgi:hypothetical protein